MALPNIGPTELILILVIVLLIFGPMRLARIGGDLGKAIGGFRRALRDDSKEEAISEEHDSASTESQE